MSKIFTTLAGLVMACLMMAAQAQVGRCVDADGKVSYTEKPCAQGQKSSTVKTYAGPMVQASAPASAAVPKLSSEAVAHEQKRQQMREQNNASHQRIDEASAKVRKIRSDNADPKKCAEAKRRMAAMESAGRDTLLLVKADPDYFHYQQLASLHCGN